MNIFLLTSFLFAVVAALGAADVASASFNLVPWFTALRWLRVHFVTLGIITEAMFGVLPALVAMRLGRPKPRNRLDIWVALNAGILSLLVGIPLVNQGIILGGGTLIFIATALLMHQLWQMEAAAGQTAAPARKFYLVGLGYFLLGIFIGTGLWLGWMVPLGMHAPIEVHIHANNWGLIAFVFAGLFIDLYPQFAGRPLAWPNSINTIFWMMTVGAAGLILGPWFAATWLLVPGLLLHLGGTILLLLNVWRPLRGNALWRQPGIWHLFLAYVWMLVPVTMAPLILLKVQGIDGTGIEQNAPQALVYGWLLQFGLGILPYLFMQLLVGREKAILGGSWLSLGLVNAGGVLLWASIFIAAYQSVLHGAAYVLWLGALLAGVAQLWRMVQMGWARMEAAVG